MFGLSLPHLLLLLIVVLLVFGRNGKLSQVMGDLGKGVRNFRAGLQGDGKDDKNGAEGSDKLPPPAM